MFHFDWTITLGTVLSAAVFVAGTWAAVSRLYSLLDKRLAIFESVLGTHAQTLMAHSARMERQDDIMIKLAGDIQRVIGRIETWTDPRRAIGRTDSPGPP